MCGQKGVAVKSCSHPQCRDLKTWAGDKPAPFQVVMACATDNTSPYDSSVGPYPRNRLEDSQKIGLRPPITQAPSAYPPLGILFDEAETNELLNLAIDSKLAKLSYRSTTIFEKPFTTGRTAIYQVFHHYDWRY
jgi:hypothetical protein